MDSDTLLVAGGRVLRPDADVVDADVLIDRATGRIEAVGPDLATEHDADDTLDASGGLVMPGLVNAHTHVAMTLLRGYADDKPLQAWLEEDVWPVEAELTAEDILVGAELGIVEMIKIGTTAFADMYFEIGEVAGHSTQSSAEIPLGIFTGIEITDGTRETLLELTEEAVKQTLFDAMGVEGGEGSNGN